MDEKKYSIILPSYNEAENLRVLLPRLKTIAQQYLKYFEIIVIDTHVSLDNTREICVLNDALYFNREPSNSYGDAIRTAQRVASGDYIIFMDSDGSHPPEFLPQLLQHVNNYDLLIASRYISGGHTENNIILVWMSKLLNLIYSVLLKIHCKDISNSFRIYQAKQFKLIKLRCHNFDVIQEILLSLIWSHPNLKIKEVPFLFKKRIHGKSKRSLLVFVFSYMRTLFKLLLLNRHIKKQII